MKNEDKENQIIKSDASKSSESNKKLSVTEYLGPDWKEYFKKPKVLMRIMKAVTWTRNFKNSHRFNARREAITKKMFKNKKTHDFVSVDAVTDLGTNRQRLIVILREIKTGLNEKWVLDITLTAPKAVDLLDALYCSEEDCEGIVILYCDDIPNIHEPEFNIEKEALSDLLSEMSHITNNIYSVLVDIDCECDEVNNMNLRFGLRSPQGLMSYKERRKINPRIELESSIWDNYYAAFMAETKIKCYESQLISDQYHGSIPLLAVPIWTEKGLFMRIEIMEVQIEEVTRLVIKHKEELVRGYSGYKMEVKWKSGIPYHIDIQLHNTPVADFVEGSTKAKINYASEIREQQLKLMHHIEEIFQDYTPESK